MKLICQMNTANIIVEVQPEDPLDVLVQKLKINYKNVKFFFCGEAYSLNSKKTFQEIGIFDGDKIFIDNKVLIKIYCRMGINKIKPVEVYPQDSLSVLKQKLDIVDKHTKFIYNGITYSMSSMETFEEIGIIDRAILFVNNQVFIG